MPRPSQCRECGMYEFCLSPGTQGCAEDAERRPDHTEEPLMAVTTVAALAILTEAVEHFEDATVRFDRHPEGAMRAAFLGNGMCRIVVRPVLADAIEALAEMVHGPLLDSRMGAGEL